MFDISFWEIKIYVSQGFCIKINQWADGCQEGVGYPKKKREQIIKIGVQYHQIGKVYVNNKDSKG